MTRNLLVRCSNLVLFRPEDQTCLNPHHDAQSRRHPLPARYHFPLIHLVTIQCESFPHKTLLDWYIRAPEGARPVVYRCIELRPPLAIVRM